MSHYCHVLQLMTPVLPVTSISVISTNETTVYLQFISGNPAEALHN